MLFNDVQGQGVKSSPELAFWLFCYVPLHKLWYGIHNKEMKQEIFCLENTTIAVFVNDIGQGGRACELLLSSFGKVKQGQITEGGQGLWGVAHA
jgi:hypothetical protein